MQPQDTVRSGERFGSLKYTHEDADTTDLVAKSPAMEPEAVLNCGGASQNAGSSD